MAKHIVGGKVRVWHHRIFHVEASEGPEKEIVLHFGQRVNYRIVKLDLGDLPSEDGEHRKITWFNNFAIQDASGKKYLKNVRYTVFLPKLREGEVFVYYANGKLKADKIPKRTGTKRPRPHMVQVEMRAGDPGVGCR